MNDNSSRKNKTCLFILAAAGMAVFCLAPPYTFTFKKTYELDTFSGQDVNSRIIGVCPLLTRDGPMDKARLPVSLLVDTIKNRRNDLRFKSVGGERQTFYEMVSSQDRTRFYSMLYNGEMVSLSRMDTVWSVLGCDYLLVFNLRQAMSINTFNRVLKKNYQIESELWDCSNYEVVWRVLLDGSSSRDDVSDIRFLSAGIGSAVALLPSPLPQYEKSTW